LIDYTRSVNLLLKNIPPDEMHFRENRVNFLIYMGDTLLQFQ